jgi:hypothetical protein
MPDITSLTSVFGFAPFLFADAHPFSYMIDMEQEWRRFDPQGHYVRRWLPVLSQLPNEFIHQPWKAPPEVLEEAGKKAVVCFACAVLCLRYSLLLNVFGLLLSWR